MGWIALGLVFAAVVVVASLWRRVVVHTGTVGLLYSDGLFSRELKPGAHSWFDWRGKKLVAVVPTTPTVLNVHEAQVISSDQFAFRISFAPVVSVIDPRAYREARPVAREANTSMPIYLVQQHLDLPMLNPAIMAAAVDAVAGRTLDQFLAERSTVAAEVLERVNANLAGARVDQLLLTSVTMPPEVRKMFTEVERAKREAQASLERARGEQAWLRALANAARALHGNPDLAQLRLLQTMESAKGSKTFILGQPAAGSVPGNQDATNAP